MLDGKRIQSTIMDTRQRDDHENNKRSQLMQIYKIVFFFPHNHTDYIDWQCLFLFLQSLRDRFAASKEENQTIK